MKTENEQDISEERCKECNRLINEYDTSWSCKKNHQWRKNWRKDKSTEKFKQYLEKRNKSMKKAWKRWFDKLNKKTPKEYASRRGSNILEKVKKIKRRRTQKRKIVERNIKI